MSAAVLPFSRTRSFPEPAEQRELAAAAPTSAWDAATAGHREVAERRAFVLQPVLALVHKGISARTAIASMLAGVARGDANPALVAAAQALGRAGKPISAATVHRWLASYEQDGIASLLPSHKGSRRKEYGWEAMALELYRKPTKPAMATVAYWLREDGHQNATETRVRYYLQSLPQSLTDASAARNGAHWHRQNIKPHIVRDETVLDVGSIYEGDGHSCDVYIAHPSTGKPWRPELTVWIDVRSRFVVGWFLSEAESAVSTLYALSHALEQHDHVPDALHVDPGSGFINQIVSGEGTGFCARLGIELMATLPGNARGKGMVEHWFAIFEERLGKSLDSYCGHSRTDDVLRRLPQNLERGKLTLPTLRQYMDAVSAFVDGYNAHPQKRLGCAPADIWTGLVKNPVHLPAAALLRPQTERKVQRWTIRIHGRLYRHNDLAAFEGKSVRVEYDLHNDRHVAIKTMRGERFVCMAEQVDAKPWLPSSRIEELKQKRLAGQIKRKQSAIDEQTARAAPVIDHTAAIEALPEAAQQIQQDNYNAEDYL